MRDIAHDLINRTEKSPKRARRNKGLRKDRAAKEEKNIPMEEITMPAIKFTGHMKEIAMSPAELTNTVRELKKLKLMAAEIASEIDSLEDRVKVEMSLQDTAERTVDVFKVRWTRVVSTRAYFLPAHRLARRTQTAFQT
jgi:hypothetical protein